MSSFKGKVVIITGASSGIGAATAVEFSKEGASVVLVGRNEAKLQEVYEKCRVGAAEHLVVIADMREPSQVELIIEQTLARFKRLDILVNNAGAGRYGGIEELTMEDFDWIMSLNLRSVVQLTKLAIPHLIPTKGNIVNVSSIAGLNPFSNVNNYCMSKAALDMFTKCSALDLGPKGIRVNAVNPAVIMTDFHKATGMTDDAYSEYLELERKMYPLGRVGETKDVADAILYLAGASATFLTGVLFPISGGKHIAFNR